ncbi:MAG: PqqD family protein [Candidatus Acidiferrum sp.]
MSMLHPELPGHSHPTHRLDTAPQRLSRSKAIVSRDIAGETIVVPICKGVGDLESVYTFNEVGRSLWRLLENGQSIEELANWIAGHYEVDMKQALSDVQSYLSELQEIGLIQAK